MDDSIKQVAEKSLELEMNSIISYEKYIKKADEEGYKNIAKLLKGLLEAERIHFKKIFLVYMGREPTNEDIQRYRDRINVNVSDTLNNLNDCKTKEKELWSKIYPEFIEKIEDLNPILAMVLNEIKEASKEHEKIIKYAIDIVNRGSDIDIEEGVYYCPTCGLVMFGNVPFRCPICNEVKNNFIKID